MWNQLPSTLFWFVSVLFCPTIKWKIDCRSPVASTRLDLCWVLPLLWQHRGLEEVQAPGGAPGYIRMLKGCSLSHRHVLPYHIYQPTSSRIKKSNVAATFPSLSYHHLFRMLLTWNQGYGCHVYVCYLLTEEEPHIDSQKCGRGVHFNSLILQILQSPAPTPSGSTKAAADVEEDEKLPRRLYAPAAILMWKKMIRVCQARPWLDSGNFIPDLRPVRTGIRVASLKYDKTQPPQTNGSTHARLRPHMCGARDNNCQVHSKRGQAGSQPHGNAKWY